MSFKIITNVLQKIFYKIFFKIGLLKNGYFIDNKHYLLTLREGSNKSVWIMTANFLFKLSSKPKIIKKIDCTHYTPQSIKNIFNKINPRCWDIIEHSISQKKISEKKNFYFPIIDINDYEASYRHFNSLIFYEYNSSIIVELNKKPLY